MRLQAGLGGLPHLWREYRLALADSHPMEIGNGVGIGNPEKWGDECTKADLPAAGFDDLWIYS